MIAIMEPGLNANFVAVVGIGLTDQRTISNCGIMMIQISLIRVPRCLLGTFRTAIVELRIDTFANIRYKFLKVKSTVRSKTNTSDFLRLSKNGMSYNRYNHH